MWGMNCSRVLGGISFQGLWTESGEKAGKIAGVRSKDVRAGEDFIA